MSCRTNDDELVQQLKHLPDFPMKPESKDKVLEELVRLEHEINPGNIRRVPMRRVLGTSLASVSGLALFAAGIVGYNHFGSQRGALPNTSASQRPTSTPTHTSGSTYLGASLPFTPRIPTHLPTGYHLGTSTLYLTFVHGSSRVEMYQAQFSKRTTSEHNTYVSSVFTVFEYPGDKIERRGPGGMNIPNWDSSTRIHGQQYFLLSSAKLQTSSVGFVRNHVIYILDSPIYTMKATLLQCAEEMIATAPVQSVIRTATSNGAPTEDVLDNITFKPVIPKLHRYVSDGSISTIQTSKRGLREGEDFTINYRSSVSNKQSVQIIEQQSNSGTAMVEVPAITSTRGIVPPEYSWTDTRLGIKFTVNCRGLSNTEFKKVIQQIQQDADKMTT